jgi:hypothetical protein
MLQRFLTVVVLTMACASAAPGQDVTITLDQFGVGGAWRPGDWTGARFQLTNTDAAPLQVWAQWDVANADGDLGQYARIVVLPPGQDTMVWITAPLLAQEDNQSVWTARVFDVADGQRGRELIGWRFSPSTASAVMVPPLQGLIGVIGRGRLGLEAYGNQLTAPPGAIENTFTRTGLTVDRLPETWEALQSYEALIWGPGAGTELPLAKGEALLQWIQRGGHLVVADTQAGRAFTFDNVNHPFRDLLPVAPTLDSTMTLGTLAPILTHMPVGPQATLSIETNTYHVESLENEWSPLLVTEDGRIVAITRSVDFGAITILGFDLSGQIRSLGIPAADTLWNRVLGRRQDTPTAAELVAIKDADALPTPTVLNSRRIGTGGLISSQISLSSTAGRGLLMAFILFVVYWLVAGPGSYFTLRHFRLQHHAWVVFVLVAVVFTIIAWVLVAMIRPVDQTIRHLTVLDQIHGLNHQRAHGWFSVFVPGYGTTRVSVGDEGRRNLLRSWAAPDAPLQRFSNVDDIEVRIDQTPSILDLPGRGTVTELESDWMGTVDPDAFGGLIRLVPNELGQSSIEIAVGPSKQPQPMGQLRNELPGPLDHVNIYWINDDRGEDRRPGIAENAATWTAGNRTLQGGGHLYLDSWAAQSVLDLSTFQAWADLPDLATQLDDRYRFKTTMGMIGAASTRVMDSDVPLFLEMLSFYQHMPPPDVLIPRGEEGYLERPTRMLGRQIDLSRWFNRPVLIITGLLRQAPSPIPITVDGESAESFTDGMTMVRWIYPLPPGT